MMNHNLIYIAFAIAGFLWLGYGWWLFQKKPVSTNRRNIHDVLAHRVYRQKDAEEEIENVILVELHAAESTPEEEPALPPEAAQKVTDSNTQAYFPADDLWD